MHNFLLLQAAEHAALASYTWVGRGQKNSADQAAVSTLREHLNALPIASVVIIGEGELDEAPMLFKGERLGPPTGIPVWDLAVDPIDGTRPLAQGQPGAVVAIAQAPFGTLFSAPDGYMEKLVVSSAAKNAIQLDRPLLENLSAIAVSLNKPLSALSGILLDKPRHQSLIGALRALGLTIYTVPDGDILAALQVLLPNQSIDFLYGIGGAPEGVIAAVAVKALGGNMQARLCSHPVLPPEASISPSVVPSASAKASPSSAPILSLDQLVQCSKDSCFVATAITPNPLLQGVTYHSEYGYQVESLLIDGNTNAVRKIRTCYPQLRLA